MQPTHILYVIFLIFFLNIWALTFSLSIHHHNCLNYLQYESLSDLCGTLFLNITLIIIAWKQSIDSISNHRQIRSFPSSPQNPPEPDKGNGGTFKRNRLHATIEELIGNGMPVFQIIIILSMLPHLVWAHLEVKGTIDLFFIQQEICCIF